MQIDVDRLIDDRPIGGLQLRVFLLCALVAILDAVDSQSIGVAGPLIRDALHMSAAGFSPAYSAGLFGAAIGALSFGPISDRFGRKPMLVFTTFLFGIFTCLTVFAETFPMLVLYRLIAGLGLGGATPCFITLAAEYAPMRKRAMLVSLLWAGYPFGNAVGGFMTAYVIKHFDWPMVFYVGGIPTLAVAVLLIVLMPESLRFLAASGRQEAARKLARKFDPAIAGDAVFVVHRQAPIKAPLRSLFTQGRATGSILLGLMLYFGFWTTTVIVLQTPTLFREAGVPLSTSAFLVAVYSLVATFGMAIAGWLLNRFGPARGIALPFAAGALVLATLGLVASSTVAAGSVMMLLGLTVSVASSGTIALAAMSYPTAMRSAGTGWVMAMGRFGQVCSPLAIGLMLSLHYAPEHILVVMAVAPLLGAVCAFAKYALGTRAPSASVSDTTLADTTLAREKSA